MPVCDQYSAFKALLMDKTKMVSSKDSTLPEVSGGAGPSEKGGVILNMICGRIKLAQYVDQFLIVITNYSHSE